MKNREWLINKTFFSILFLIMKVHKNFHFDKTRRTKLFKKLKKSVGLFPTNTAKFLDIKLKLNLIEKNFQDLKKSFKNYS